MDDESDSIDSEQTAPSSLARWHGDLPRSAGKIKTVPEDFVVEEIPAYEPAGSGNAENIQVVLDATTDEPAITLEGTRGRYVGAAGNDERLSGARPLGARVTAINVRQHIRSNKVTGPYACGIARLELFAAFSAEEGIAQRATDVTELTISEHARYPATVELPIITDTNRSEPAATTQTLIAGDRNGAKSVVAHAERGGLTARQLVSDLFWPTYGLVEKLHREDQLTMLNYRMATRLMRILVDRAAGQLASDSPRGRRRGAPCRARP